MHIDKHTDTQGHTVDMHVRVLDDPNSEAGHGIDILESCHSETLIMTNRQTGRQADRQTY